HLALAGEAREILARMARASEAEPISSGDLSVRAPRLRPPALAPSSAASPAFRPASSTAPSVEDATIGAVPEALKTFAASLAGPVDVFEWVRNNVRPDFYYGVMKGPVQAFL